MLIFKTVRESTLDFWLKSTKRKYENFKEDFVDSFECKWQNYFSNLKHISIFCSLGEWNSNLTELLTDNRFDSLNYEDEGNSEILFRFYTRILLIISEILTDFQDILSVYSEGKLLKESELDRLKSQSRKFFSSEKGELERIFCFINNVCKHKVCNIHKCNHHLPIYFEDSDTQCVYFQTITIKNIDKYINPKQKKLKTPDSILIPKLIYFVEEIIFCFQRLDKEFMGNKENFKKFCKLYEEN